MGQLATIDVDGTKTTIDIPDQTTHHPHDGALVLDPLHPGWDHPTVTTKADVKRRIVLPGAEPGDVYDVQRRSDGTLLLVKLQLPEQREKVSREECLAAMEAAPLHPSMSWEELAALTREP